MYGKSLAAVAALATVATAFPRPIPEIGVKGFTVHQTATGRNVTRNGPAAHAKALAKYKATVPSAVIAAAAQQSGSVTANSEEGDSEYVCDVYLGTNSQKVSLDFDTGSSDLWVFSGALPASQQSGHSLYDPTVSPLSGYSWSISYGDGSGASGTVYKDQVVIGGVTATSQAVEAATSLTASQSQPTPFEGSDGLVGLAFSSINTVKPEQQTTFFDTVKDSLPQQLFTATLKHGEPGSYDFGYIDDSKYSGDLVYTSVDSSQGFWQFTADSVSANGQSLGSSINAIADTGTTLILLDDDVISSYYSQVDGAENSSQYGGYVFDCSASLPDFIVTVGGSDLTIPGSYINFQAIDGNTCYGGMQSNSGIGFSILGDVFLKALFVVFDSNGPQLGFAPQA